MNNDTKNAFFTWASLKNVDVYFERKKVLSNINLNLNYGENIVILGPNGSGKSTLLKLLNRSIYPIISNNSSFELFNKENINIWELRKKVGFLFKEMENRVPSFANLYDVICSGFSGTFNARYSNLISNSNKEKIENLINEWELNNLKKEKFETLSDGQKRRALIARALVHEPKLLVLDEPFCNLDIKSNYILNNNLDKLMDNSVNIVYVTNNFESIFPNTNRVILIKNGNIIKDGCPSDVMKSKTISELFQISINLISEDGYWRGVPNKVR